MSNLLNKTKKHLSYEGFWASMTLIGVGVILLIYSLINFNNWNVLLSILGIIGGILIIIFSYPVLKKSYKDM